MRAIHAANYNVRGVIKAAEKPVGRMLAWRVHSYGSVDELRLEEARVPPLRAPDELLIRVHAASINPIDVAMIGGYGARILNTLRSVENTGGVEFPLVTGRDFVGVVERAGAAVGDELCCGDRVWGVLPPHWPGSHAQFVTTKKRLVGRAPEALGDTECGGALYAALTACSALRTAGLGVGHGGGADRNVLLLGLGGVGHAALQLLVYSGAQVIVGCSKELEEAAGEAGATVVLDRHSPDYQVRLRELGPYDVVLECAGIGGSGAEWLSNQGVSWSRYVTLSSPLLRETDARGLLAGGLTAAATLVSQSVRARTVSAATAPLPVRWAYFLPLPGDIELLRRLAERGLWGVRVEQVYPWGEAVSAYKRAAKGKARGKLVIDFTTPLTQTN